jgi:hypothetical protein
MAFKRRTLRAGLIVLTLFTGLVALLLLIGPISLGDQPPLTEKQVIIALINVLVHFDPQVAVRPFILGVGDTRAGSAMVRTLNQFGLKCFAPNDPAGSEARIFVSIDLFKDEDPRQYLVAVVRGELRATDYLAVVKIIKSNVFITSFSVAGIAWERNDGGELGPPALALANRGSDSTARKPVAVHLRGNR